MQAIIDAANQMNKTIQQLVQNCEAKSCDVQGRASYLASLKLPPIVHNLSPCMHNIHAECLGLQASQELRCPVEGCHNKLSWDDVETDIRPPLSKAAKLFILHEMKRSPLNADMQDRHEMDKHLKQVEAEPEDSVMQKLNSLGEVLDPLQVVDLLKGMPLSLFNKD